MRELVGFPPIWPELQRRFKIRGKGIIITYGDAIYNPERIIITPQLRAHESVHSGRQLTMGVEKWWDRYFHDTKFRFDEELAGHRAEFQNVRESFGTGDDGLVQKHLNAIALRLSGPLYGNIADFQTAKELIRDAP